ncbi:hypothetical protein [Chitinophaga sp.]|uniref:hypothetical protein n=1 Tax=Chitinophaga sp. TaxID=1869181 RepID=UPI002CF03FC6|nr:hypothetical protein [Chitinophaga sp.]HWV66388.1 hypothetical protein [Chitinophaga sp.]
MTNNTSSIFEKDFPEGPGVRRWHLIPLALKIYAYLYLALSAFSVLSSYMVYRAHPGVYDWKELNTVTLFSIASVIFFPLLRFLPNLLIVLEKKYAIILALAATAISILAWCYTAYITVSYGGMNLVVVVTNIFWLILEIPYLVMLINVRKEWEKGSGRP